MDGVTYSSIMSTLVRTVCTNVTEYKVQYTFFRASQTFKSSFSASASSSTSISISCMSPPSSCDLMNYKIIQEN